MAVIKSIQPFSITISAASSSNTATINSVTTGNTILIYNGLTSTTASQTNGARHATRIALTNGTTITATRGGTTDAVTVTGTAVEFSSGVNSIQAGTIAIAGAGTSNTATISAVGANAFVIWQGCSTTVTGLNYGDTQGSVELTNTTTVTARCTANTTLTVGYMVADLDSTIVNSIQQRSVDRSGASTTSFTDTITSVTANQTLIFYNGIVPPINIGLTNAGYRLTLTNGTTVTGTRSGSTAQATTVRYTVVEFAAAALNGNVARGTITITTATSNTASVTNSTLSCVNWCNLSGTSANDDVILPKLVFTDASTLTATLNSSGSIIVSYEAIQFAGSSIKTINGLALASVKTVNGLAIASVKTVNGLA